MTQINPRPKWAAAKKVLLALPLAVLTLGALPQAHADDHYGRLHHEIRQDERRGDYRQAHRDRRELHRREGYRYGGHYYHNGRYYSGRRYYYSHGHRYYRYYGYDPGFSINIGL